MRPIRTKEVDGDMAPVGAMPAGVAAHVSAQAKRERKINVRALGDVNPPQNKRMAPIKTLDPSCGECPLSRLHRVQAVPLDEEHCSQLWLVVVGR